jgi:hypothetical protein
MFDTIRLRHYAGRVSAEMLKIPAYVERYGAFTTLASAFNKAGRATEFNECINLAWRADAPVTAIALISWMALTSGVSLEEVTIIYRDAQRDLTAA